MTEPRRPRLDTDSARHAARPAPPVMIGRQPIFDRRRQIFGYELRFCATGATDAAELTPDDETAHVLAEGVLAAGLDRLTHGHRAFIELTPAFLRHDVVRVLPANAVVLQVPCDAAAEPDNVEACRRLKQDGYAIAATRVGEPARATDLLALADFVKVDFLSAGSREIQGWLTAHGAPARAAMIAGNVDAVEVFNEAVREGFTHVQGFFFERPAARPSRAVPRGQIGYLHLLYALSDPNLSLDAIEDLVKRDASLCYRLLSTVNSAGFAQSRQIASIRDALLLVGRDTIRRWASLWVMTDLGAETHAELALTASIRGRFCEILASRKSGPDAGGPGFLLGLCSCLDVMLDCPMAAVLDELPLTPELTAALLGRENALRHLLDCVIAYERGDWRACLPLADLAGVTRTMLADAHIDALGWITNARRQAAATTH